MYASHPFSMCLYRHNVAYNRVCAITHSCVVSSRHLHVKVVAPMQLLLLAVHEASFQLSCERQTSACMYVIMCISSPLLKCSISNQQPVVCIGKGKQANNRLLRPQRETAAMALHNHRGC